MSLDYVTPKYGTSAVAKACEMNANTFRGHWMRGNFKKMGPLDRKEASADGLPHLFSLRDAMGLAAAAELMRAGVPPGDAYQIAMWEFAHFAHDGREPAQMYDIASHGFTVLIYHPGLRRGGVIPMKDSLGFADLFKFPGVEGRHASIVVLLNDIERKVFWSLGVGQD